MWKISLILESPIAFDEKVKVTSVPFFIPDFDLLSFEIKNVMFKILY